MSYLDLQDIRKSFDTTDVIKGVDLQVDEGEFCVFVGPSGCGKSTLLRLIAGLEVITSGKVQLDGREITHIAPSERDLAMVFQSYALYPHKTVRENLAFSLMLAKKSKAETKAAVDAAADRLQLTPLLDRKPGALSGGQRQRVAIGRAIVRQPKLFLFDEPLSNLDAALRVKMRIELAQLHQSLKTTMIYVTHDQIEAMTLADKVVVLHDGIIEQVGKPMSLYQNPANRFVAEFIGTPKMNILPSKLTKVDATDGAQIEGESYKVDTPIVCPASMLRNASEITPQAVDLGIRPEHIQLCEAGSGSIQGEIILIERMGSEAYVHVQVDGLEEVMLVKTDGRRQANVGEHHGLQFAADELHIFTQNAENNGLNLTQHPE